MPNLFDYISTLQNGVNSDLHPSLLDKNTAAWTINSTLRGGFARPRPPLHRRTLVFPSDAVQTAVETGFFQGAGYYRPDFGSPQLVAQIGGRLFTFTPGDGENWNVVEITIPGDPNDATTNQVWMNQAEKWLIISDGTAKLPIFWDGVTARRSYGPSVVIGSVVATSVANPSLTPIGQTLTFTLAANYTGPFDVPLLFNGEFYQPIATSTPDPTYDVILTNVHATSGAIKLVGSVIEVRPGYVGFTSFISAVQNGVIAGQISVTLNFAHATSLQIGDDVNIPGYAFSWKVAIIFTPTQVTVGVPTASCFTCVGQIIPAGTLIKKITSDPNTIIGTTVLAFTNPATSANVTVAINSPYSGAAGQTVWIDNDQYTIQAAPPPAPSTSLNVINLSDTGTTAYSLPQDILSVPELPAGRMGAYGLGHQAWCLVDGISFIYGDAVGGPAGTQANNYRDSVLKTTENDFLTGGGSFRIPNSGEIITSMTFAAILDAAYGQGPLIIGTPTSIFTCAVPTDRAQWIALTNPILTQALIAKGPLAQNSTIPVNSDTLFRSSEGVGSLIFGRRDFETWGNVPISAEMDRTVTRDIRSLLSYGSAVTFDNRFLSTAAPQVSGQGVYHIGTLAMNFDPVSSLRGKAPSIWESLWTGTNVLQYVVGTFNSTERCFQFTFNQRDSKVELWEQLRSDVAGEYFDNGVTRIGWLVETPCIFKPEDRPAQIPIVRLNNGKIHLRDIVGTVRIKVQYRPDFWPCWVDWAEFDVCATVDPENPDSQPGYKTPIFLGTPSSAPCEEGNNRVMRSARFFQIRLEFLGQAVFQGGEFEAVPEPSILFGAPECNVASE